MSERRLLPSMDVPVNYADEDSSGVSIGQGRTKHDIEFIAGGKSWTFPYMHYLGMDGDANHTGFHVYFTHAVMGTVRVKLEGVTDSLHKMIKARMVDRVERLETDKLHQAAGLTPMNTKAKFTAEAITVEPIPEKKG